MCAFRRTALSPSKSCTVVSGVHTVIYGCPHTRAMCGRHFAGGAPRRGPRHGQPTCWPPRPACPDAGLTPPAGPTTSSSPDGDSYRMKQT